MTSLVDDGNTLIDDVTEASADVIDFRQKLDSMKDEWQNVLDYVEGQRVVVECRLALWLDVRQSLDRLRETVDEADESIHVHAVATCDYEQAKELLSIYHVSWLHVAL